MQGRGIIKHSVIAGQQCRNWKSYEGPSSSTTLWTILCTNPESVKRKESNCCDKIQKNPSWILQIINISAEKAGEVGAGNVEHNCPTPHRGAKIQTSSNKYKTKGRESKVPEEQPTLHMHFFHCLRLPFLDHHLH